jgi:hypothetical protein
LQARRALAAVLVGLICAPPLASAPVLSAIVGSVRLEGGAALPPGLELRLIHLDTGRSTSVPTSSGGTFQAAVEPGLYAIDVGKSGYEIASGARVVAALPGRTVTASLSLAAVAQAVAPPPSASGPRIVHEAVGCMAADENPEIDAVIEPAPGVTQPRVYFHSARDERFLYVEMIPEVGRFVACLPAPRPGSGPVTYYVSASADGVESRIADIQADVIDQSSSCPAGRRMAVVCPCAGPVAAYLPNGALATPVGFAAGAQAAGIASTAIKIGAAVGIVGIGLVLGDNATPASPSR